ncbi:MAG: TMEM175 family protein [Croceibacterium sp.]
MREGETSGDLALDRLVFFSDAVFAIAVTLLVLEIHVPHLAKGASIAAAWHALTDLVPSLFAFVLSFLVIGRFWMGHHERFRALYHYDVRLMWPNMLYLMAIAFMPFATAFLGSNLGLFVPALVYNLSMFALSLLAFWLARVIRRLSEVPGGSLEGLDIVLASLVCIGITFVIPVLSQWGMMTIPLWTRLENRLYSSRPVRA